jgi:hypothetical protein
MSGASPTPDDPFDTPEKAYAEAERLIAEAKAQGGDATELRVHLRLLERLRLPPSTSTRRGDAAACVEGRDLRAEPSRSIEPQLELARQRAEALVVPFLERQRFRRGG